MSCMFNMKIMTFGTDQIIGQIGDSKFFEFFKDSYAVTCAKGTDNTAIVLLGIIVDDIKTDVAKEN